MRIAEFGDPQSTPDFLDRAAASLSVTYQAAEAARAPAPRRSACASAHGPPRSPRGRFRKIVATISGDYPALDFFASICHSVSIEEELML